jgi:hypothetical protein
LKGKRIVSGLPPLRGLPKATGYAGGLLLTPVVSGKKRDMPDEEYRAVAFFKNREYLRKPGSLTLLYKMYLRCCRELPEYTKEIAFDLLAFRFMMYAEVLKTGGYDGRDENTIVNRG